MRHSFPKDPQSHDVCVCMLMKESVIDFEFTLGERECVCVGWGWGWGWGVIAHFVGEIFWLDGFVNFHPFAYFSLGWPIV